MRQRVISGFCGLCCGVVLMGCGTAPSLLRPLPETPSTIEVAAGLRVAVDTVAASPELEPPGLTSDDVALLARFYTAVWVDVRNGTSMTVTVDPGEAMVFDRTGTPWIALDSTQRAAVLRWRPWSWGAWMAGWTSAGRLERLTATLDRLQLKPGPLAAGEERRGLLVFKRIPTRVCQRTMLEWRAVRVEDDPAISPVIPATIPMVQMAMTC